MISSSPDQIRQAAVLALQASRDELHRFAPSIAKGIDRSLVELFAASCLAEQPDRSEDTFRHLWSAVGPRSGELRRSPVAFEGFCSRVSLLSGQLSALEATVGRGEPEPPPGLAYVFLSLAAAGHGTVHAKDIIPNPEMLKSLELQYGLSEAGHDYLRRARTDPRATWSPVSDATTLTDVFVELMESLSLFRQSL